MNDEQDDNVETGAEPPAEPTVEAAARQARTSDDFLVPGPSPESNEGLGRWGLTWLAFSLLLILLMLCVSFACLTLANWTGVA